jgi:predicted protein tyrosine phosphatase
LLICKLISNDFRSIGAAEIIDIMEVGHEIRLKVRYKALTTNNKEWFYCSDIDLDRAIWKEKD